MKKWEDKNIVVCVESKDEIADTYKEEIFDTRITVSEIVKNTKTAGKIISNNNRQQEQSSFSYGALA